MPQYPLTLIKVEGKREIRVVFRATTYEIITKEPGRVGREEIRYDYSNTTRQEVMKLYYNLGFISIEEL